MPVVPHRRALTVPVMLLLATLITVIVVGVWVRWRPVSDQDVARLSARATVAEVHRQTVEGRVDLPADRLSRQLDSFGPPPTPAQQRHLDRLDLDRPRVSSADDAATQLSRQALTAPSSHLAAQLADTAASWWRQAPEAERAAARDRTTSAQKDPLRTVDRRGDRCLPETVAVARALDRVRYTTEAAAPRTDRAAAGTREAITRAGTTADRVLDSPAVSPLTGCEPSPVRAVHLLPEEFAEDPEAGVTRTLRDAGTEAASAIDQVPEDERAWLLETVRLTSLTGPGAEQR